MKFIDCHVHMGMGVYNEKMVRLEDMLRKMDEAKVDAVSLFSIPPVTYREADPAGECPSDDRDRLELIIDWMSRSDRVYGMYFIDPTAEDALNQADEAVKAGITGFKVICNYYYPDDPRAMKTYAHIAELGKPIQFHSGILWSPHPSSKYNRPVGFEPLLEIPKLRFSMAHVSWPWVDEFIALYGYSDSRKKQGLPTAELFVDTTPGTPPIYREDALFKLYNCGYSVEDHIMLGTDCRWSYDVDYSNKIQENDKRIFAKLGLSQEQFEKYSYKNYLRFIGEKKI